MECVSLFTGIGGFDVACHWMGWTVLASVEKEPFPSMVTRKHFPNIKQYEDIKDFPAEKYKGVDFLCGGFPCQPFSIAGARQGDADERYLWPPMFAAIKKAKPRWVMAENVPGIIDWDKGSILDQVLSDLESEGFEVQTFVLPSVAVGAPHKRDRVWIIAYSSSNDRCKRGSDQTGPEETEGYLSPCNPWNDGRAWENFPTQPPLRFRDDGLHSRLVRYLLRNGSDVYTRKEAESEAKNIITKVRRESITAAGNAVVPQLVFAMLKTIEEYDNLKKV